jgi:hypothetical protein
MDGPCCGEDDPGLYQAIMMLKAIIVGAIAVGAFLLIGVIAAINAHFGINIVR